MLRVERVKVASDSLFIFSSIMGGRFRVSFMTCIRIVKLECTVTSENLYSFLVNNDIFELSYVTDTILASHPTMK